MSITSYQPVSSIIRVTIIKRAIFHFSLLILDDVCYTRRHRDENRYCPTSLVHPFSSNQDLFGQIRDERERPFFFLFNLVNYLRASDVLFFVSFSTQVYIVWWAKMVRRPQAPVYTHCLGMCCRFYTRDIVWWRQLVLTLIVIFSLLYHTLGFQVLRGMSTAAFHFSSSTNKSSNHCNGSVSVLFAFHNIFVFL